MYKRKPKVCVVCGKPIPESRTSNIVKYCGEACKRKREAEKRKDYIARRAANINKVSQLVYNAYDCKCALCGWQATAELISYKGKLQYAHGNTIHHITAISDGGGETPDNIILLCPNHHKQADLGLISKEELRKHTKPFEITEEEKAEAKSKCAEAIAKALFG